MTALQQPMLTLARGVQVITAYRIKYIGRILPALHVQPQTRNCAGFAHLSHCEASTDVDWQIQWGQELSQHTSDGWAPTQFFLPEF